VSGTTPSPRQPSVSVLTHFSPLSPTCTLHPDCSEEVLGHLSDLVRRFVEESCLKHNLSPEAAKKAGGKIYTYGSYRLGVHGPGTDIDTLVVGPKHVERQDFNETFLRMLEQDPSVSEVSVGLVCLPLPLFKIHAA